MLRAVFAATLFGLATPSVASDINYDYINVGFGVGEVNFTGKSFHGNGARIGGSISTGSVVFQANHTFFDHDIGLETTASDGSVGLVAPFIDGDEVTVDVLFLASVNYLAASQNGREQDDVGGGGALGLKFKSGHRFEGELRAGYVSIGDFNGYQTSASGTIFLTNRLGVTLRYHLVDLDHDSDSGAFIVNDGDSQQAVVHYERDDITLGMQLNF